MYYCLETDGMENVYMRKQTRLNAHAALSMGRMWDAKKDNLTLPYKYTMEVDEDEDPVFYGWYPGSHLMQTRLVEVLKNAGVDNYQTFPTEIRHAETNELVEGYVTFNIVGRVACANLAKSKTDPLADVYYFHDLVIDPTKAHGLYMFRVHESPMLVLLHELVAEAVKAANFTGLTLEPVKESA